MVRALKSPIAVLGIFALAACTESAPSASDTGARVVTSVGPADAASDEQAIRAINPAWFKAVQAGNVDDVGAFYSDDAVVSAPGAAPARGTAAIREIFTKEIAAMTAAGLTMSSGSNPEVAVSGDLGYEWNTYTVTDKSGKTVDAGKYLSVFGRRNGKWLIVRDIWNSDMPPAPAS